MNAAIVVPAHNEELLIDECLDRIEDCVRFAHCAGHRATVYVACDACTDSTEARVRRRGHRVVALSACNVGMARALGARKALNDGAAWLAFTDADTLVEAAWLTAQLSLDTDVVCGTVSVQSWGIYGYAMQDHFAATYTDADDHRHIHGANLGMSASAYIAAGGFAPLANREDVDIVRALTLTGARIKWSALPRVVTSARPDFRATAGFGATLRAVAQTDAFIEAAKVAGAKIRVVSR